VWRNSKRSLYKGGGASDFFSHGKHTLETSIPLIANGMDMQALVEILMQKTAPQFEKMHETWDKNENCQNSTDKRGRSISACLNFHPNRMRSCLKRAGLGL
jgi:hypothetical protein